MVEMNFSVDSWSAWSSSKVEESAWRDWANGLPVDELLLQKPDVSIVPAMQRRRMSSLSKMVFATANKCMDGIETVPNCIFSSQHGELNRTVKIVESLAAGRDVSPTDFSLSVHSTALGLYSIFTHNEQPSTMVVGGADTFGYALIEANNYLNRFPGTSVLLLYFDEPLPSSLNVLDEEKMEPFSIALLLSAGVKKGMNVSYSHNSAVQSDELNLGMEFLKFYLSARKNGQVNTTTSTWCWSHC